VSDIGVRVEGVSSKQSGRWSAREDILDRCPKDSCWSTSGVTRESEG
jgi:hypothetical protein